MKIKRRLAIIAVLVLILAAFCMSTAYAADTDLSRGEPLPRFIDDEDLLSSKEAATLTKLLDNISDKHEFDVVVAVVSELDSRSARLYAADFFEQNGFGYDGTQDGAILLLATEDRDFGFASFGHGLYVFTSAGQDYLDKHFLPQLKEDQYYEAFLNFANAVDDFLMQAKTGKPYDTGNTPMLDEERQQARIGAVIACVVVGFLVAKIATGTMKRKLKTVRRDNYAHEYVVKDSMVLLMQKDIFLHRHVDRTARAQSSSSSGGSGGSFSSSSGSSATGHSGKY